MEWIVGTLFVLGLLAVFIRFAPRTASGGFVLPRVIDNSIGMWTLRRVTGLRLWEQPIDEEPFGGDSAAYVDDVEGRLAGRGSTRVISRSLPDTRGLDAATARRVALLTVTGQRERAERLIRTAAARPAATTAASKPRWARVGALAAMLLAALILLLAAYEPPMSPGGQVLSATATPGQTAPGSNGSPAAAGGSATPP